MSWTISALFNPRKSLTSLHLIRLQSIPEIPQPVQKTHTYSSVTLNLLSLPKPVLV